MKQMKHVDWIQSKTTIQSIHMWQMNIKESAPTYGFTTRVDDDRFLVRPPVVVGVGCRAQDVRVTVIVTGYNDPFTMGLGIHLLISSSLTRLQSQHSKSNEKE